MNAVAWGATGQSVVLQELLAGNGVRLVALFDNDETRTSPLPDVQLFFGRAGFAQWKEENDISQCVALVAIGGARGADRLDIQAFLKQSGMAIGTAIHRAAFVASNALVGEGSQILAGATISARAKIGEACIVNTAASVDHDCALDDGVHVGPGACLAGEIIVERCAFIGTGAVILPRVRIGEGAIVGAGAVVTKDVQPGAVVYGNPGRPH